MNVKVIQKRILVMKLVKPKAEILIQQPGLEGIYKQIELAGRTCYKSEDKITPESAKPFVDRMIASGHTAMLEHGTVYLNFLCEQPIKVLHKNGTETVHNNTQIYHDLYEKYDINPYSTVYESYSGLGTFMISISTNFRVLVENGWLDDLQYLCEPTKYHEKRYTFKVTTSIGVTRELNRHRVNSIAESSTRYCNYSKDKFGNEVTFCIPSWMNIPEGSYCDHDVAFMEELNEYKFYLHMLDSAERNYMYLIEQGLQPQQAREVLPLCTATEAVYTAFESDWNHFFDLRYFESTGKVHPNMKELTTLMYKEYENYKKEKRN